MAVPNLTPNSPAAGSIAWSGFNIQYAGVGYSVAAGSTANKYVWWVYNAGSPTLQSGNTLPANLTGDDLVLFVNKAGVPVNVQASTVIDGSLIVDGSIVGTAVAAGTLHGDRIQGGTLTIGQTVGLQTELDAKAAETAALASMGTDLVVNGTGSMGDNTNFTGFTANGVDVPTGSVKSFYVDGTHYGARFADKFIPFDPAKKYKFSFQIRQTVAGATNRAYGMLAPYDAFGNNIQPKNYMFQANTTTTLAQPLNDGDTVVYLTNAANWYGTADKPANTSTHFRSIIFWDWVDPNGKVWPQFTYSRNYWAADEWADGAVDATANTITLRSAWTGGSFPAGHPLSNGSSGGSYIYMPTLQNHVIPEQWTTYSDVFNLGIQPQATAATGRSDARWVTGGGMPPATAQIKIGWLFNAAANPANSIVGNQALAAVSFSDASAAQATADGAAATITDWKASGKTTINGGKIETDTVTTGQLAAQAITSKHTITGALIQTSATAARGIKFTASQLLAYDAAGVATLSINGSDGSISMKGALTSGSSIAGATVTGTTVTGGTLQTEATASRGIKITSAGLIGYDDTGAAKFTLTPTGGLTIDGAITSGGSITGATVTGGVLQTVATAFRGIKIVNNKLLAYPDNAMSDTDATLVIDGTTGAVSMKGTITAGSTISGANITSTSADGVRSIGLSNGIISLNPGSFASQAGVLDVGGSSTNTWTRSASPTLSGQARAEVALTSRSSGGPTATITSAVTNLTNSDYVKINSPNTYIRGVNDGYATEIELKSNVVRLSTPNSNILLHNGSTISLANPSRGWSAYNQPAYGGRVASPGGGATQAYYRESIPVPAGARMAFVSLPIQARTDSNGDTDATWRLNLWSPNRSTITNYGYGYAHNHGSASSQLGTTLTGWWNVENDTVFHMQVTCTVGGAGVVAWANTGLTIAWH